MMDSLFNFRSWMRSRLVSGSALERVGLLTATMFPLNLLAQVLLGMLHPQGMGALPAEWSAGTLFGAGITSVLFGAIMHYAEQRGDFSFGSAG